MTDNLDVGGPGTTPTTPKGSPIEFVLAQQANDAIAKGADPKAVSDRLGQMVSHLRANPEIARFGSEALSKGADTSAVANRVWQLSQSGRGNINLGSDQTSRPPANPTAPQPKQGGAGEGIADRALDMFTLGMHRRGLGVTQALGDIVSHGLDSHPIDTYHKSVESTLDREKAAESKYPLGSKAADAAGFGGALAAEGPLRGMLGLGSAAAQTGEAATGLRGALSRVGNSAKVGAGTGAVVGGLSSNTDNPGDRLRDMGVGGILGGAFGGAGQSAAEAFEGGRGLLRALLASPTEAGTKAADASVVRRLAADNIAPKDLLTKAAEANRTGSPAVLAHLGGPSLDPLTWLAAQGPSREAGILRSAVTEGQRQEAPLLNRGLTEMSGVKEGAAANPDVFKAATEAKRAEQAATDYPKAYAGPPITDARILNVIKSDPQLMDVLNEGVNIMNEEQRVAALHGKLTGAPIANPLEGNDAAASLLKMGVPQERITAAGLGSTNALPVQMLDYMKRGVDPVIEQGIKKGNLNEHTANLLRAKVNYILEGADATNPLYKTARSNYANYSRQVEGGLAGAKAMQEGPASIAQALSELETSDAQNAYRTTATDAIRSDLNARGNNNNLSRLFDNATAKQRLNAIYGAGNASKFDPYLEQGNALNRVREATTGNSATEPRKLITKEVLGDESYGDPKDILSPRRAFFNIPAKILDAREAERKAVLTQVLAKRLGMKADDPELPALVEHLYRSSQPPMEGPAKGVFGRLLNDLPSAVGEKFPTGSGILAGLLSGGGVQ